jgi:GWxTD domain-containing protein
MGRSAGNQESSSKASGELTERFEATLALRHPMNRKRTVRSVALLALAGALTSATLLRSLTVEELHQWANGPVQWLMLVDERKQLRRIDNSEAALAFVEAFWSRRDPDPARAGNPSRELFSERVTAADILYVEGGVRGSLTDRGRALIVLGPPRHVTVSNEPALAWDAASDRTSRVTTRKVEVEMWGFRLQDLPPELVDQWMKTKQAAEDPLTLTLAFRTVGRRTVLVEGEPLLEIAARAIVRKPTEE